MGLPSRVAGDVKDVTVVRRDHHQGLGQIDAHERGGDGLGEGDRVVQGQVGTRSVVTVVDPPTLDDKQPALLVALQTIEGARGHLGQRGLSAAVVRALRLELHV